MPVEEIPVHEKVRRGADHRYGCWCSQPAKHGFLAKDGLVVDTENNKGHGVINVGRYRMKYVEHTMSSTCRHPEWETDPGCQGCTSERDEDFIALYWKRKAEEVRQVLQNTVRVG